jgi:hypothetical protein
VLFQSGYRNDADIWNAEIEPGSVTVFPFSRLRTFDQTIAQNFPLGVQAGKGPDIAIWAHDKVGEWADGGVIASVEVTAAYKQQFYPIIRFVSRSPKWLNYLRCLPVQSRPCCKQASLKSVVC